MPRPSSRREGAASRGVAPLLRMARSLFALQCVRAHVFGSLEAHPSPSAEQADELVTPTEIELKAPAKPAADVSTWVGHVGRCCQQQRLVCASPNTPRSLCAQLSFEGSCEECEVWGDPSDSCHLSAESCTECTNGGLYCKLPSAGQLTPSLDALALPPEVQRRASPVPPPPLPPSSPVHWSLGRQHIVKAQYIISCSYAEDIEFVVQGSDEDSLAFAEDDAPVFKDTKTASKEKCCEKCAHDAECVDFVYGYNDHACVLLPHVPSERIDQAARLGVVSGTAGIELASPPPMPPPLKRCTYAAGMAFAGGVLPEPTNALPVPIDQHACCSACAAATDCGKFTLNSGSGECTLHRAYAQPYTVDSKLGQTLVAGTLQIINPLRHPLPPFVPPQSSQPEQPMQPMLGAFNYVQGSRPSPPSLHEHDDSESLKKVIAVSSAIAGSLVLTLFLLCTYCFFAPQILTIAYRLTNGRLGRIHISPPISYHECSIASSPRNRKRRGLTEDKGEQSVVRCTIKVTVSTRSIVQSKDVNVAACHGLLDLRHRILSDFAAMKHMNHSNVLIFALAEVGSNKEWLLVTSNSNFQQVLMCEALMIRTEDEVSQNLDEMLVAFPKRSRSSDKLASIESEEQTTRLLCNCASSQRKLADHE
ncbi:MAG: hypothetical protein SGPRY_001089 [Prymnesium sp.]